jgi:hypothetical protein
MGRRSGTTAGRTWTPFKVSWWCFMSSPTRSGALDELGALVGAVSTADLLDRIFSRFCIGK